MATNPLIAQGTLNRVRASLVVAEFPNLTVASSYMGDGFVTVTLPGEFSQLLPTATGAVTSPEPYVLATVTVDLLRTQSLSTSWLTQAQTQSDIGDIQVHSDTAAFPAVQVNNVVIDSVDPGAFDGKNPVVRLTLRGVYYLNNDLWNMT